VVARGRGSRGAHLHERIVALKKTQQVTLLFFDHFEFARFPQKKTTHKQKKHISTKSLDLIKS
jgi:hypothetical protein